MNSDYIDWKKEAHKVFEMLERAVMLVEQRTTLVNRYETEITRLTLALEKKDAEIDRVGELVAKMSAAEEREACAEICERFMSAENCAQVIRARGQHD